MVNDKQNRLLHACPACDLLVDILPEKQVLVRCHRCAEPLSRPAIAPGVLFWLGLSALLMFLPAMLLPILSVDVLGQYQRVSIVDGIQVVYSSGDVLPSLLLLLTLVVFPFCFISLTMLLSAALVWLDGRGWLPVLLRWTEHLQEWMMLDIYIIALLVAMVKLMSMANLTLEVGLVCLVYLIITMLWIRLRFDVSWYRGYLRQRLHCREQDALSRISPGVSARIAGLLRCDVCEKLYPRSPQSTVQVCRCCHETMHSRHPGSLLASMIWLLAGILMLGPALVLPMMEVSRLGGYDASTIMQGVVYFIQHGALLIGLLILLASVFVPLAKILVLGYMQYAIWRSHKGLLRRRILLFRLVRFIGRWSMLDIFVVALMVSLVNFGTLVHIMPGPALGYFAAAVICTMMAANTLDTRLIWDAEDGF